MLMDRIKNWLKLLALWAWVHFITLLASDPDSVPKLKYVTEEDGINILADETTDVDQIKSKKKRKNKLSHVEERNEEESVIKQIEETDLKKGNDFICEEISKKEQKRNSDENESLEKSQLEDEEEKDDKDEEDDIPWLGVGRGTGLTRYSGIQNLLDTTNTTEEPLIVERRQPVLIPRRDGPLVLQRPSFGRSLSHEKERLSEIPEEEKQSPPSFNNDVSNESDKLWASLVARYGKEDEADKINLEKDISRCKDHIFDVEAMQQPIFTSPEESISSEEFSNQVEERLQRYLSKIDKQNMLAEANEIENLADETEAVDEETREMDEYEVDTPTFDENGRLGKENKIFILIEDDDSNEEKEENVDRKFYEALIPDDNFSVGKFEVESMGDYQSLKAITEEEETISDYDDLQFDSSSNLITKVTELQPIGNKADFSDTILDTEFMSVAAERSPDYFKNEDDDYQEDISDEEDVIEEEKTAVFTISLHKKPETSLLHETNDDVCTTGITSAAVDCESPIVVNDASNKFYIKTAESEVDKVDNADKKDLSFEFLTKERRQSRDLWKIDCEKFLGEQESSQDCSLEEREDFIFTTYDEFPEDCVPVAEGLLAITEKFGIPLDVETPKDDEEEDDSIVDSVFEEPRVLVDNDEITNNFSEVVSDETNSCRDDELTTEKHGEADFFEYVDKSNFIPGIANQEENFVTAKEKKIYEPLELETNEINNVPYVTTTEKLDITAEESLLKRIASDVQEKDTDQEIARKVEQYGEIMSGMEDVIPMNQEAYDLESVSVNVKEEDTVENEVNKTFKSDYEETEASILLEPFQEKSFSILLLEKHLLAGSEDNEDLTDAVLEENHFDVDMNTEDAPSSEYSLEKLVKEEPVLDFKYHVICDIDFDDFSIETSENLRHSILEEHAEIKLDDSPKLEAVIESELIQILEQMEEEEPEKVIDAENNFEKNSEVTDVCADETKSSVCEENISESFINELTHKNVKKISQKDTKIHISAETKALAPYANKSYKSDGAISEQDSNEQKKTVAKVKKGKLDSILKRFEEKEEPVIKKLLPKKRFEVKAMETKPTTVVEIKIDPVMGDEHSSEQKATSISSVPSNKEESLEENTPNLPVAKVLSPIVIKDNVEAILEESPVFTLKQNISQIDASSTEGISEIQTSKDNLKEKSSTNVIGELTEITVEEKSLDNQSSIASELAIDAFSSNGTEKLKEVILPTFLKEEMCSSEKKEVGDSLGTTKEDNVEISFKQISPSEAKAEHAEPVIGDQISDNIVTVTLPRRKKLLIPKNFEETSEPKQMVKTAVKKGKLDNILKRFEEKESKPTSIKVPSKLDSSSKKAFEIKSKDLELSLSNLPAKDVKDNELETKSLFLNKDSNKDMEIVLIEEQVSTTSEVVNEPIKYDHESLKTIENSTLDCKKECVLSSLESSTDIVSYDEHEATVKVNDETKCTASIKSEADSHFNEKLLDETPLELERSDKSPIEKDSFVFNFQEKALPLNKKKSTSLLNLGPEKIHEQFIEDGESYYVLDEIKQQQETLNVVDIDVEKEKSYWFDSKENLREAEILSERKASIKDESTFWFEEVSTQHENDTSSFWFEENSANNIQEETVPNESTENIASKDETLTDVVNIETKKRHSYFSEEDDDLYFLRKAEGEKPFTEEKDEELALLRKETMELSKPKKIKKDFEDTKSVSERPFSGNIKSSEISEEDRLEKERILCAIRSEREVSKSGVIPEEEIPDYLDDVKDLLVPKIRRKKGRRNTALDDLMKVDEPDLLPKVVEISKKDLKYKQPLTTIVTANVEAIDAQQSYITSDSFENEESEPVSNKFLTEEEEYELIEIQREQEALRASQRKELEKYLSMPAALTEQEQLELEELLAEEETDRTVNAVSEARLEALLNEVRKRIGNSEMDLDTAAALEEYIGLPIGLTEEEELLLSNVGEEKDRNQFASDDEYRDYIKQRYLDELEDERIRVEEDEYEFGGYYEDDYEYDGDEDYDEEFMEEDYDLMESDNTHQAPIMKDEAVGGDEPMDSEMGELKKSKSLLASLSSLRSKGSKSSSGSLDKQGSNYSSKEGSSSDLQKESSSHTQSKKFFRYGGLSIKRKKKSKIFSEIDPGIKNEDILSVNELPQNLVFKHNDAFDIENNDYILASSPVETEFNKNENCSCDSDEAFVIISKDIFNSITNFCAHESIETAPPCQDSPTNKITGSDIFNSTLYNECKSKNESKAQKSNQFEKGISNFIDPTLPTLLLPEREHEENDSKDSINEINIDTSVDINSIHEGCSSSLNDSSISESLEVIDSEKRECSKPSNCEIPNIIITDVSNITTKIFSLLKQKTVQQRNRPISPLNQIQNTMTISSNTDANTNKGVKILQRDGEQHSTKKSDINNGSNSSEPLTYLDNHFSLINDVIDNKETPSGKSRLIEEAKLKVSKMSEVTSGPDAVSALEEDSLEYQSPAADVVSAASNFAQVPPTYPLKSDHSFTHNSNQMSLQELIEAELNSRLAPLQPDSLEGGGLPDYHEHIRTTVTNGDATATCSSLLDSLEASPFSLDSLVDVESGVDLTSPPNPALGGSPPSPYSPFIHNSSSNQFNNINLNGHQKSNLSDIPENKTSITSEAEDDFEILESLPSKKVNDLKTENLIQDFTETNENLELSETIITEVKDIPESNDIILIDEDDNVEDMEHVVVENITFEINTTSETVLESHCLQNGLTNGFEQKAEKSFIEHKIVEKQLYNVKQETLNEMFIMSEEKVETCSNGLSEVDIQEQKSKPVEDVSETTLEDTTNSLDKEIISPAYDLIINDFHEIEQPKTASTFEKFYQADSFSDFKINHFNKSESVDKSTTIYQQSEVVSSKISNVDFLETVDSTNDPNESNNFSQSEDSKLNNFSQSEDSKINNFSQSEDSKLTNFNQSESLPMETNHKLITNIVDVSNSYNIIDVINNKDVVDVYNNGLLPADVHVTNMEETELWPEEEDGKKEEMDEFQKMEQEVEREMEEEQKKKKKSDTDKRGKKKKKRKGESEKENKELSPFLLNNSFSSADEEVDYDDVVIDDVINGATRLNGLHSPFENDKQDHHDQLTTVENDDLANISVKQLTASYLSVAEQSPRKRSPSPNSTPIRPRTPISRLVGTYSSSQTPAAATHSPATVHASTPNGTANHIYPSDFTPGITLKSLKSAYEASAQKRPSPCASPVKEEVHVSFSQLREAYCNVVASHSPREGNSPTPRSTTPLITPSTFRSMTRSCCDIRMACKDYEVPSPPAYKVDVSLLNVSVKALTRSFSDLTRMGTAVTRNGSIQQPLQSPQGNSFGSRKVSVKELRKSYEDLPRALIIDVTSDRKLTSPNRHNNLLTTTNTRLNCSYTNIHLCANFSGSDLQKIAQAGGPKNPPFTGVSVINRKTAYQSKDELYEKHVGPRIRSFDAAKMKSKFNKPKEPTQVSNDCRICGKLVFQMEKIVAEKASWHKNCFRCSECNKNLTLETYQSHEGSLYCKPHFKELFRPKAVVQDEAEERKDRLLRRPRMIILESQPEILPDDVVRATEKPDYGLDELQTSLNVKERFAVFESYSKAADEPKLEPVSVRRSQSLMSKAARFSNGHQNGDLEDEEEEEYESGEEMEGDEEEGGEDEDPNYVKSRKKKERPMSFSGMGDLKAVWEQKQRREEMTQARKEDITKFRQMLCAGKNITLKEMFESGNFEGADDEDKKSREEIKIEDRRAAHNLKARFEKGQPFILEDEEGSEDGSRTSTLVGEKQEVEEVFRDAQTAKQARNVFKQIDSKVIQEGSVILRSPSFAMQNRDNRRSLDISLMMPQRSMSTAEVVKSSEPVEEELQLDTTDLANRFKFFATFEERQKEETEKKRKVFRITPPREGAEQVEETLLKANIKPCMAPNCTVCKLRGLSHGSDDSEVLGRDPNLIKCTDNYQDEIDCRNTKNILQMFKKMEMGQEEEEDEEGPRPLKCFTPPPEDGDGEESEYSDEEYSDEGEDDETDEDEDGKPKFKDELLEMEACPQSARKAANLRAKFEKWEVEVERKNELNRDKDSELEEECRPSLDTTRNLKAMFEHKAIEVTKPVTSKPVSQKINRFVGGGEKCMACDKTVYAMEKLEIHGKILHKNCFKCFKCNSRLSMGSFSFGGEQMFCTTHYKQLFTEKGSYDAFLSGKDKWTSKIEATNSEAIKSHD